MLYLIGLGLSDESDVSLKAIEMMKRCELFAEFYTAKWHGSIAALEVLTGKKIRTLAREEVESDFLVTEAAAADMALLVPGDPLTATTHMELLLEAKKRNVPVSVIHSSSIYTAVAETGLQLYKFGRTTTLAMPEEAYLAESPYEIIAENKARGLHTLVLLDITMSVREGIAVLQGLERKLKRGVVSNAMLLACSKLGSKEGIIRYGTAEELMKDEYPPPAVLIVPGTLHFKEEEALELWKKE